MKMLRLLAAVAAVLATLAFTVPDVQAQYDTTLGATVTNRVLAMSTNATPAHLGGTIPVVRSKGITVEITTRFDAVGAAVTNPTIRVDWSVLGAKWTTNAQTITLTLPIATNEYTLTTNLDIGHVGFIRFGQVNNPNPGALTNFSIVVGKKNGL